MPLKKPKMYGTDVTIIFAGPEHFRIITERQNGGYGQNLSARFCRAGLPPESHRGGIIFPDGGHSQSGTVSAAPVQLCCGLGLHGRNTYRYAPPTMNEKVIFSDFVHFCSNDESARYSPGTVC
jgi:hypothetical protein